MPNLKEVKSETREEEESRYDYLLKELEKIEHERNYARLDWTKFNLEMKVLYGHPTCEFCEERMACFCQQCIAPTPDEVGYHYCHTCHAKHLGVDLHRNCPTCKRPWPKEKADGCHD